MRFLSDRRLWMVAAALGAVVLLGVLVTRVILPTAQAALAGTLTGTVADSNGVRPLHGADIRISTLGRVTNADAAGRFRFTDLPEGSQQLVVSFPGAATQNRDVTAFRLDRLTGPPRIVPWPVEVAPQDPLTAEDAAFLKACRERSEPEVTGEAGRAALKLALDILDEMKKGR